MPSRRTLLHALGAGAVALAGCSTDEPRRSSTRTPTPTDTATAPPTATESPTETSRATPEDPPQGVECETAWSPEPRWTIDRTWSLGTPVVTPERLFVASEHGLLAIDPTEGSVHWQKPDVTRHVYGVADGVVLATDGDRIVAIDAASGDRSWTFEPPGEYARTAHTVPVHAGTVYVGAAEIPSPEQPVDDPYGRLYGLDLATGEPTFVRDLTRADEKWVEPDYVVAGDDGVFLTRESGGLVGLDHDGTVRWRRDGSNWYYRPALGDGVVLQPTSTTVVAVDSASGETLWEDGGPEMHVAVSDGVVYGAGRGGPDRDGTLAALDATTGEHRWETTIRGCGRAPAVGSGVVALPIDCRDHSGHVGLYDAETGCQYGRLRQSADLTPALAVGEGLYASVGGDRERLLAFDLP